MNGTIASVKVHDVARRSFLSSSTFGVASVFLGAVRPDVAQWTESEQANLKLVNEFCAAYRHETCLAFNHSLPLTLCIE
jgi:hypothetical protein